MAKDEDKCTVPHCRDEWEINCINIGQRYCGKHWEEHCNKGGDNV